MIRRRLALAAAAALEAAAVTHTVRLYRHKRRTLFIGRHRLQMDRRRAVQSALGDTWPLFAAPAAGLGILQLVSRLRRRG